MSTVQVSTTLDLANLVSYQEGSVVSRQITKADAGNVTLFAFDAGQNSQRAYRARTTPWCTSWRDRPKCSLAGNHSSSRQGRPS